METVILAYNKLSVSTISSVFKEIESSYKTDRKKTTESIIRILCETEIESNLLAVSSLLKLIYSVVDTSIVEEIISKVDSLNLYCYIFSYALVDDAFINSKVSALIEKKDVLSVLKILQMCSTLLDKSTLDLIESGIEDDESVLVKFIKESVRMIKNGKSPYRKYLQEELKSVESTITEILKKYSHRNTEVITTATESDELIAVKYGMNTSLKKKIFSIITSSPDYIEAQRALYKQIIRKVWHIEEIVKVSVKLCIAEKTFNIYYPTLVCSIYATSSSSHRGTIIKYIYQTVDEYVSQLSKLSVKEIYNLGMLLAHLYSNEINALKLVINLSLLLKKEEVLVRVLFKGILNLYNHKKIKKFRRMKETTEFRRFFKESLIDHSFLKESDREMFDLLYREMFIEV